MTEEDKKPYIFSLLIDNETKKKIFITINGTWRSDYIPLENWKVENKEYLFNRICYTKENSLEIIKNFKSQTEIKITQGVDLYAVCDCETGKEFVTVWNIDYLPGMIEIHYKQKGIQKTKKMKDTISRDKLKQAIWNLMNIQFDNMEITNLYNNGFLNHILRGKCLK